MCLVGIAPVVLLQIRFYGAVSLVGNDFPSVNDLFALLNQSAGQWYAGYQFVLAGLAAILVVDEVGHDIFVEIAFLQQLAQGCYLLVHEKLFVCLLGRINLLDGYAVGLFLTYHAYHCGRVFAQFLIFLRLHDTLLV